MRRIWLHNIRKLSELKHQIDVLTEEMQHESGEEVEIEIESCGHGRICLDVVERRPWPSHPDQPLSPKNLR